MMFRISAAVMCALFIASITSTRAEEPKKNPVVVMETSMGTIEIELNAEKAPITVKNFLDYVNDKFYDGTIFHRVMNNFMIQGGGFTKDMKEKDTKKTIKNEADNGLKNDRGTIAMARLPEPDTASAQWFINVVDNDGVHSGANLNHVNKTDRGYGYAVFGKVTAGMDVVDKIKVVKTGTTNMMENVPTEIIEIKSIRLKDAKETPKETKEK